MMMPRLPLATILTAVLLAGCSSAAKQENCPTAAALVDASAQTVFRQGTVPDPGNVLYALQIVRVKTECSVDKKALEADSSVDVTFRATRAPTGEAVQYTVPYFLAVTQSDRIINKQSFSAQFSFAPGQAAVEFTDSVASTVIHTEKGKRAFDYEILIGLPLTKEQLDYNRTFGRFTP
jgi:hypothetical protein